MHRPTIRLPALALTLLGLAALAWGEDPPNSAAATRIIRLPAIETAAVCGSSAASLARLSELPEVETPKLHLSERLRQIHIDAPSVGLFPGRSPLFTRIPATAGPHLRGPSGMPIRIAANRSVRDSVADGVPNAAIPKQAPETAEALDEPTQAPSMTAPETKAMKSWRGAAGSTTGAADPPMPESSQGPRDLIEAEAAHANRLRSVLTSKETSTPLLADQPAPQLTTSPRAADEATVEPVFTVSPPDPAETTVGTGDKPVVVADRRAAAEPFMEFAVGPTPVLADRPSDPIDFVAEPESGSALGAGQAELNSPLIPADVTEASGDSKSARQPERTATSQTRSDAQAFGASPRERTESTRWNPLDLRNMDLADVDSRQDPRPAPTQAAAPDQAQATASLRWGFELAQRRAYFSARARLLDTLRTVARSLDEQAHSADHSAALRRGLTAFNEAADFYPREGRPYQESSLADVIAVHDTVILQDASADRLTPQQCVREYLAYAEQELARAAGNDSAAAQALYGLGRLQTVPEATAGAALQVRSRRAIMLYQAALRVDDRSYAAANELGVMLARHGQLEEAVVALQHAVRYAPEPAAWQNLAAVHERLGQFDKSRLADREAQILAAAQPTTDAMAQQTSVQWVDAEEFARMPSGSWDTPQVGVAAAKLQQQQDAPTDSKPSWIWPRRATRQGPTKR